MSIIVSKPYRFRDAGGAGPCVPDLDAQILATQPANLLAYYKCDELSGNLTDSSGNGNHTFLTPGFGHTYGLTGGDGLGTAISAPNGGWLRVGSILGGTFNPQLGLTIGGVMKRNTLSLQTAAYWIGLGAQFFNNQFLSVFNGASSNTTIIQQVFNTTIPAMFTAATFLPNNTTDFGIWTMRFDHATSTVDVFGNGVNILNSNPHVGQAITLDAVCVNCIQIGAIPPTFADVTTQHAFYFNTALTDSQILDIHNSSCLF